MTILVVGAGGFIGRHLVRTLAAAGHTVRPAGTNPAALARLFPGLSPVRANYAQDDAAAWSRRLGGVRTVVNAAGLIRETPGRRFRRVHDEGPRALFDACRAGSVRRIIQISALGADAGARTRYHLSKRTADDHLLSLDPARLQVCVVRPSLVLGPSGASTNLFARLAALPLPPRLGSGRWVVQPIHVDDLVRAVAALVDHPGPLPRILDAVGPRPATTDELIREMRYRLGLPSRPFLPVPRTMLALAARMGDLLAAGPLTSESLSMLQRGNTGSALPLMEVTGVRPRPLTAQLSALPEPDQVLKRARLDLLRPPLRLSIAGLWIWTCVVSLGLWPLADSLALVERLGLTGLAALVAILGAALWDGALGLLLAFGQGTVLVCWVMLATMAVFTGLISIGLPDYWLHPMGPVSKNIPLAMALVLLIALEADT